MSKDWRWIVLASALALLWTVNYLDLVGVLRWDLQNGTVLLLTMVATGAVGLTVREFAPLSRWLKRWTVVVAAWAVAVMGLGAYYADAGTYYAVHATTLGPLLFAGTPVIVGAIVVLGGDAAIAWTLEYRELTKTTPEERFLERTD